jgi:hypothetical protein
MIEQYYVPESCGTIPCEECGHFNKDTKKCWITERNKEKQAKIDEIVKSSIVEGKDQDIREHSMRGTCDFFCPICNFKINSGSFSRYNFFETACRNHLIKCGV